MFKSFVWDFISKFSNQLIAFIVSIFLTRLLQPAEFGVMGIALFVIAFSSLFVDLGFGKAIIQQQEIADIQLSTVFFLNSAISIVFAGICFLVAGPVAVFFDLPQVKPVLEVISVSFIFYGLNVVPTALLYRKMNFKVIGIISTAAALLSGLTGIYMAQSGYGVWSLVAQNVVASFLTFLFTVLYVQWLPRLQMALIHVKGMWQYSSRLFASAVIDTVFSRMDIFLIGRMFPPAMLGYYTRAQSMDGVVKQISSTSIVSVLFPFLSRMQDNTGGVRELYKKYLHIISFIAFFLSGFLYLNADSIFTILFTERWVTAAMLFKILTISGFVYPISALMVSILSSRGNSKAYLKAEIFKKLIILPAYIFGFFLGLYEFVYTLSVAYIFAMIVNMIFVRKEIKIGLVEQMKIVFPYALVTVCIVAGMMLGANLANITGHWTKLLLFSPVFFVLFIGANLLLQTQGYNFVTGKIISIFRK